MPRNEEDFPGDIAQKVSGCDAPAASPSLLANREPDPGSCTRILPDGRVIMSDMSMMGNIPPSQQIQTARHIPLAEMAALVPPKTFRWYWDIPEFLDSVFQAPEYTGGTGHDDIFRIISDQVVVHGNANNFRCLTCKKYLENTYGDFGQKALEIFVNTAVKFRGEKGSKKEPTPSLIPSRSSPRDMHRILFELPNNPRLVPIEHALRWLCAAIRLPPLYLETKRDTGRTDDFQKFHWINLSSAAYPKYYDYWVDDSDGFSKFAEPPPVPPSLSRLPVPMPTCWTSLFERGIIMDSPAPRPWGVGLEVSFSMMVSLAGVDHKYQIGTGYALLGFFTALVPISHHKESGSIQWHLETNEAGIDPDHLNCTSGEWLQTMDMKLLTNANCFVGWFEEAHIMLGTRQLATDKARRLQWTRGLDFRQKTLELAGHEVGLQGGVNMGPINIITQASSAWMYRTNVLRFSASRQFTEALNLNRPEVALVIDAGSRRAWLVPLVSWILHLCHRYCLGRPDQEDTPIPFAERSSDGATATISAVESKGDTVVCGTDKSDPETLRQLWLRISTNLGVSHRNYEDPTNRLIFAAEAMDITMSRDSYPKELPVSDRSASWVRFAQLAKTTTVCANLGNAIVPVPPSGKLCECCTLLENEDFLAAHTWSLARLLEQKGCTFSQLTEDGLSFKDGTSWRVSRGLQELWTVCPAGAECSSVWGMNASSSSVLQRAEKVIGQASDRKDVLVEDPMKCDRRASEAGVVVFGGGRDRN